MELLARIITEGSAMRATREALDGLVAVRHTAMSTAAYRAYTEARSITLDDLYTAAEAWGLGGWEV